MSDVDASTYDYADPESNVTRPRRVRARKYPRYTESELRDNVIRIARVDGWGTSGLMVYIFADKWAAYCALADAAIAWLDQGQLDRDERLLKAARQIKALRSKNG